MSNRLTCGFAPSTPAAKPTPIPKKRPSKNWLHVNIGQSEAKELRALAECQGITLRTFLEMAIRSQKYKVAQQLKIKAWQAPQIPRQRRKAIARRNWEMARAFDCPRTERN